MTPHGIRLGDLVSSCGGRLVRGDPAAEIDNVHYDSRALRPGGLFVALRGGYVDGHDYLDDARKRGAVAALVENSELATGYPAVAVVEHTREALSPLAATFYRQPAADLGIIGVTGTDGKTTTSYLIDAMLRANRMTTGLVGTVAIRIGDQVTEHDARQTTPESLEVHRLLAEMRDAGVDWAVLEATSHALALYRLRDCPFDIGVITNVTREHLDFHGSVESYRAAKAELIRKVERSGGREYPRFVVVNHDDPGAREIGMTSRAPVFWFSLSNPDADLFARDMEPHPGGTRFRLSVGGETANVNLKLIGDYNVFNAMAAAGVGYGIGLTLDEIRNGLESLANVPGRMERIDLGQPFGLIVDYAHSPASLRETLNLVRSVTQGRVIAVSGSAGERDRGKRPEQGRISAELADFSIFTSEDPRFEDPEQIVNEIAQGAESTGAVDGTDFRKIENRREAIEFAVGLALPGDTILLAGKGHETCMIYGDERVPWNEAQEAIFAIRRSGYGEKSPESEGSE